eukprot:COSAG06_NODE_244_length_19215_cov_20.256853_18_plen_86_part_00
MIVKPPLPPPTTHLHRIAQYCERVRLRDQAVATAEEAPGRPRWLEQAYSCDHAASHCIFCISVALEIHLGVNVFGGVQSGMPLRE